MLSKTAKKTISALQVLLLAPSHSLPKYKNHLRANSGAKTSVQRSINDLIQRQKNFMKNIFLYDHLNIVAYHIHMYESLKISLLSLYQWTYMYLGKRAKQHSFYYCRYILVNSLRVCKYFIQQYLSL